VKRFSIVHIILLSLILFPLFELYHHILSRIPATQAIAKDAP